VTGGTAVDAVRLAHGARMPRIGLGTWPMGDAEAEAAVTAALGLGYRLVDTAHAYGNEVGVGRALRAGGVAREDVFLTTKLNGEWHGVREAHDAFAMSAERLGVEYLDLFLIHWPNPWRDRYVAAWEGLVGLLEAGRVRAIGVCNFKAAHLDRLLSATGVAPDVNQIELNPRLTRSGPRAYHAEHGIATQCWAPLGRGGDLLVEPAVTEVAARHGRTPAQVVLRWHVEHGLAPIPKSSNRVGLGENLRVFDFTLTAEDVAAISALDRGEAAATHDSDEFGH
jgi:2,5-diketo-D-gluconate reductase A